MGRLFLLLWLISPAFLIIGVIKPSSLRFLFRKTPKRTHVLGIFLGLFTSLFFLAGSILSSSESSVKGQLSPTLTPVRTALTKAAPDGAEEYLVTKIVDGDTLKVEREGRYETVRLIGVDTPETVDPRKPIQCFGEEASRKMSELLNNQKVMLEVDRTQGERDKYNRLLRYVFLPDGTHINKLLIEQGYAYEYTYDSPYKYQTAFKSAQASARKNKRGLWADNACVTPTLLPLPLATIMPSTGFLPTDTPYLMATPVTRTYVEPSSMSLPPATNNSSTFSCDCSKACSRMSSCEEAYYQLKQCGCLSRDGDDDGVPCENICPGG